jgi:hypothetical protein
MADVVYTVQQMQAFLSEMKELGLKYSDLEQIDGLIPIRSKLDSIIAWKNGYSFEPRIEPTEKPIEVPMSVSLTPEEETADCGSAEEGEDAKKHRKKPQFLLKKTVAQMLEIIKDKGDGKRIDTVHNMLCKKFPDDKPAAIRRMLDKISFADMTDPVFSIDNDKIRLVKATPCDQFNTFEPGILDKIKGLLKKNDYDVVKTITPQMSANDVVKIALARLALFNDGVCSDLGGGVKEILIMETVAYNKGRNTSTIQKIIKDNYGLDVDVPMISAIKTKRSYKEICDKFEMR